MSAPVSFPLMMGKSLVGNFPRGKTAKYTEFTVNIKKKKKKWRKAQIRIGEERQNGELIKLDHMKLPILNLL